MVEILAFLGSATAQLMLTFWLIRRDERRLTPTQETRRFPEATFWIALFGFGPLAIPVHFVRTRRTWGGALLGFAWLAVTLVLSNLVAYVFERSFGIN